MRCAPLIYLAGIFLSTGLIGCQRNYSVPYLYDEGLVWNTAYHINYQSEQPLTDSILAIFKEIDLSLSPFNPESVVSKINDNRSDSVNGHFQKVFNESLKINEISEGAFDPTLAPLIRAWGFGQGHEVSQDTLKIDSLLRITGISKCSIKNSKLIKENPSVEFNFSAIAKGYGVDQVAALLERHGIENYLIEIGGEIRAHGVNPSGEIWKIGIDSPEDKSDPGNPVMAIKLRDCGLATSGNYRNYHLGKEGKFGHTISAKTGRPVQTDIISATVIAPECMTADALATTCMTLGSEDAIKLCNRLKVGAFLILQDMQTISNAYFPPTESLR